MLDIARLVETDWPYRTDRSWAYPWGQQRSIMTTSKSPRTLVPMETLIVWIVLIAALVALDAGALRWGVDSRDALPDDHHR